MNIRVPVCESGALEQSREDPKNKAIRTMRAQISVRPDQWEQLTVAASSLTIVMFDFKNISLELR